MYEVPQLHQCQEVASFVGVAPVRLIGRILRLQRPLARILHRQCGSDDQHLGQALLVACREQHARHPRIERQLRELPADGGELVALVDRVELGQQLHAVGDGPSGGRLDKWEPGHIAEPQRLHPQDHAGE